MDHVEISNYTYCTEVPFGEEGEEYCYREVSGAAVYSAGFILLGIFSATMLLAWIFERGDR